MSNNIEIRSLKVVGAIPEDSVVISRHNNLVTRSDREQTVSRISTFAIIAARADPGDLIYSHRLAHKIGEEGGVLAPVEAEPVIYGDSVVSTYPMLLPVAWDRIPATRLLDNITKFNEFSVESITNSQPVRTMDIGAYAQDRLNYARRSRLDGETQSLAAVVQSKLDEYNLNHNFMQMTSSDRALVHGDMQSSNVVMDGAHNPLFIDLDSAAIGPKTYDLASWAVRVKRGDSAPIDEAVISAFEHTKHEREALRAMIGWKVISSMTHMLRYGGVGNKSQALRELATIARELEAPGEWSVDE